MIIIATSPARNNLTKNIHNNRDHFIHLFLCRRTLKWMNWMNEREQVNERQRIITKILDKMATALRLGTFHIILFNSVCLSVLCSDVSCEHNLVLW